MQTLCSVIRLDDIATGDGGGPVIHEGITPTPYERLRKLVLLIVPPRIRVHIVLKFEFIILSHFIFLAFFNDVWLLLLNWSLRLNSRLHLRDAWRATTSLIYNKI